MLTLEGNRFLVLGHRGASAHAPDNSRAAFQIAAEQGADGVELDVRRTADGQLVVHHDPSISDGTVIIGTGLDELRERAPDLLTLAEAMAACAAMLVNVEIKNSPSDPDFDPDEHAAEMTTRWLMEHGWTDRVIVSSFNPATVDRVRAVSGTIATGQLIIPGGDVVQSLLASHQRGVQALHPHVSSLFDAADVMDVARSLDMWVLAWTVNDVGEARALRTAGVTGVITDDPSTVIAALAEG